MRKLIRIAGQRFGKLLVIERSGSGPYGQAYWRCQCDCGNERIADGAALRRGNVQSCGCLRHQGTRTIDLVGQTFGKLTVIERAGIASGGYILWRCRCACGRECAVRSHSLRRGATRSCGCSSIELRLPSLTKHGASRKGSEWPEYRIWVGIKQRCENPRARTFRWYGARGITVCERWRGPDGFAHFISDMGRRPSPDHSIDRKDNDLGYEPTNCRWATDAEQANNQRRHRVPQEVQRERKAARAREWFQRMMNDPDAAAAHRDRRRAKAAAWRQANSDQ